MRKSEVASEPSTSCDSSFCLYVDNCCGILQEVPDTFDFGTLKVKLKSLEISPNYVSFGSECGALFLFSRFYKRALKPLRTTYDEIVTCQKWFHSDDHDYLAVGHRSGTLILIHLPSGRPGGNRKLKQSIHDDKRQEISCVDWSLDGRFLYSGDVSGLILCVKVDFEQEVYETHLVHNGNQPIRQLRTTESNLIVCYSRMFCVFSLADDYKLIVEKELPRTSIGFTILNDKKLLFALDNVHLIGFSIASKSFEETNDLCENAQHLTKSPEVVVGGMVREIIQPVWTTDDFQNLTATFYTNYLLLYSTNKIQLFYTLDWKSFVRIMFFDLRLQLKNSHQVEILNAVYDNHTNECFVLTSTQKLLRLAFDPPASEMIFSQDNGNSILSSLSSAAQNSSRRWFNKFATAGEFQPFAAPINLPAQLRLPENVIKVDEYRTKIASNLNTVLGQLKQTPFVQNDSTEKLADDQEEQSRSQLTDDDQSANDVCEHKPVDVHETKVEVKRKRRIRREKSPILDDSEKTDPLSDSRRFVDVEEEVECTVDVQNLDKLFGVLGLAPINSDGNEHLNGINALEQSQETTTSESPDRLVTPTMIVEDDKKEISEELHTESESEDEKKPEIPESELSSLTTSQEDKWDNSASTSSLLSTTESSNHRSTSLSITATNAEYELISRLLNHRTDMWDRIKLPYEAASFDVCANYMVICSKKKSKHPQYRLFEPIDNAIVGGDWRQLKYNASVVAVNDNGTLLWRVESGIALAPFKVDKNSPFSSMWLEQANEGIVETISLTNTKAWYLTNKGPYLQMNLPDMGILFYAECPYRLTQITATEQAVWALREETGDLVVRVGLKHCPMGFDWVENTLPGPKEFVSIALFQTSGLGLDNDGNLWLCNGVDENRPFGIGCWQQVCSPTNVVSPQHRKQFAPIPQWRLKVCSAGVFINVGKFILSARQPLTAHSLDRCIPERIALNDNFGLLSASGFMGNSHDCVYVCQPNSEIFSYSDRSHNLTSLPPFDSSGAIISLSAIQSRLYVLDSSGVVHVRTDLNSWLMPRGKDWTTLTDDNLDTVLISFAASAKSLWAIRDDGTILYSDLLSNASECCWQEVDKPKTLSSAEKADQIRCSPSGKFVWIMSTATNRMWSRCDVNETERKGYSWSDVCNEIRMAEVAVADNAVYALSASNSQVHRLRSMTISNPSGLYWKPLPLHLRAISVDAFEQRIWGLDFDNRLVKHKMQIFPRSCISTKESSEGYNEDAQRNSSPNSLYFSIHED
ncbi:hypothetical protein M3Y96_00709400 [Aphelenchoides besseyi]|nr:hypothetical protein M3Y96_00709400 [Aphelenchoides besseyi]